MFFGDLPAGNSTNSREASANASDTAGSHPPPTASNRSLQYTPLGTAVHHPLWLGFAVNLINQVQHNIVVPHGSQESVQLRGLTLLELGQGPGAMDAESLEDPSVWTHLLWAVNR